jgi:hypothetical protein
MGHCRKNLRLRTYMGHSEVTSGASSSGLQPHRTFIQTNSSEQCHHHCPSSQAIWQVEEYKISMGQTWDTCTILSNWMYCIPMEY